ncbi:hypothetical protein SNE35_06165 [Paucibacter sp. R3-3]|uniref:Uncharacterized protein n=1 Tax=Roseateles agri TaxID=3098619 RepID=A0ABU5DCR7_9BURK|nr:hypothetical protein [Paucibacter sp. R3-3]MDY0744079.1 hypothetical protein [Paucibacter sp. R3-3]
MLAEATAPAAPAPAVEPPLSPALQGYLRNCVRDRLRSEGRDTLPWFRIHLYLRLGDAASAAALDRDLREQGPTQGLIALFGDLEPGLTIETAMARQLDLMSLDTRRYAVMTLHGDADCLHRVMPCPTLVFCPAN